MLGPFDMYSDLQAQLACFGRYHSRAEVKLMFYRLCFGLDVPATEEFVIHRWSVDMTRRMEN